MVGGGFIGVEFAQMFARFGSKVTVLQRADRLVPTEDAAVSRVLAPAFEAEGIDVHTSTACTAVAPDGSGVRVACEGDNTGDLVGSHLLLAAGGTPNTDQLGLDHLDLPADARGYLDVDDHLRTSVEDVWALGDLRGTDMFTHTARDDAEVAYRTVFKGQDRTIANRIVPTRCSPTPRSLPSA